MNETTMKPNSGESIASPWVQDWLQQGTDSILRYRPIGVTLPIVSHQVQHVAKMGDLSLLQPEANIGQNSESLAQRIGRYASLICVDRFMPKPINLKTAQQRSLWLANNEEVVDDSSQSITPEWFEAMTSSDEDTPSLFDQMIARIEQSESSAETSLTANSDVTSVRRQRIRPAWPDDNIEWGKSVSVTPVTPDEITIVPEADENSMFRRMLQKVVPGVSKSSPEPIQNIESKQTLLPTDVILPTPSSQRDSSTLSNEVSPNQSVSTSPAPSFNPRASLFQKMLAKVGRTEEQSTSNEVLPVPPQPLPEKNDNWQEDEEWDDFPPSKASPAKSFRLRPVNDIQSSPINLPKPVSSQSQRETPKNIVPNDVEFSSTNLPKPLSLQPQSETPKKVLPSKVESTFTLLDPATFNIPKFNTGISQVEENIDILLQKEESSPDVLGQTFPQQKQSNTFTDVTSEKDKLTSFDRVTSSINVHQPNESIDELGIEVGSVELSKETLVNNFPSEEGIVTSSTRGDSGGILVNNSPSEQNIVTPLSKADSEPFKTVVPLSHVDLPGTKIVHEDVIPENSVAVLGEVVEANQAFPTETPNDDDLLRVNSVPSQKTSPVVQPSSKAKLEPKHENTSIEVAVKKIERAEENNQPTLATISHDLDLQAPDVIQTELNNSQKISPQGDLLPNDTSNIATIEPHSIVSTHSHIKTTLPDDFDSRPSEISIADRLRRDVSSHSVEITSQLDDNKKARPLQLTDNQAIDLPQTSPQIPHETHEENSLSNNLPSVIELKPISSTPSDDEFVRALPDKGTSPETVIQSFDNLKPVSGTSKTLLEDTIPSEKNKVGESVQAKSSYLEPVSWLKEVDESYELDKVESNLLPDEVNVPASGVTQASKLPQSFVTDVLMSKEAVLPTTPTSQTFNQEVSSQSKVNSLVIPSNAEIKSQLDTHGEFQANTSSSLPAISTDLTSISPRVELPVVTESMQTDSLSLKPSSYLPFSDVIKDNPLTTVNPAKNLPLAKFVPRLNRDAAAQQLLAQGWRFKERKGVSSSSSEMIARAVSDLTQSSSAGRPLDVETRQNMEGALGQDFSQVRIHKASLTGLNVQAAAKGRDVYVESDRFDTPDSMALLGHELTHVAQQGFATPLTPSVTTPSVQRSVSRDEAEAEQAESQVKSFFTAMPMVQRAISHDEETALPNTDDSRSDLPLVMPSPSSPTSTVQRAIQVEDVQTNVQSPPESSSPSESGSDSKVDLGHLAQKIYPLIKQRLRIERELIGGR